MQKCYNEIYANLNQPKSRKGQAWPFVPLIWSIGRQIDTGGLLWVEGYSDVQNMLKLCLKKEKSEN